MIIPIKFLDVLDIFFFALILFQLYRLIKGTAAFSIFIGIFFIYLFWLLVRALNMELISSLLGQVIGVGVLALIIVFQQEVRRFLLVIGNRYLKNTQNSINRLFSNVKKEQGSPREAEEIARAAESMASKMIGALIVIGRQTRLDVYSQGGEILNADISAELLETIFFKNTPLHDGAVLIQDGRILAARCPLPITERVSVLSKFGMRHRAAIGISEQTDALVVVVSEETGELTVVENGKYWNNINLNELRNILLREKI